MTKLIQMLASYCFLMLIFNFFPLNVSAATAANPTASQSMFDLISHNEIVELTLTTDLELLKANKNTIDYQKAIFNFADANGIAQDFEIKVRPRGKYRRRVCDFVPLKLNFSKKDLAKAGLKGADKMKLVTHCMDDKSISKETVMKEYLAYKLYNELSDNSLRVQLVKITYICEKTGDKIKNRYGFLIEDIDDLADRINSESYELMNVNDSQLVAGTESTNSFFQYMIGNADWDMKMLRNVKLLQHKETGKITVVPFDFDFSGLVDATYAVPNPDYRLTSVQQRHFLGQSVDKNQWNETVELFQRKRQDLINIIISFKHLKKSTRESMVNYLDEFFVELEAKQSADKNFQWSSDKEMIEEGSTLPNRPTFKK